MSHKTRPNRRVLLLNHGVTSRRNKFDTYSIINFDL